MRYIGGAPMTSQSALLGSRVSRCRPESLANDENLESRREVAYTFATLFISLNVSKTKRIVGEYSYERLGSQC